MGGVVRYADRDAEGGGVARADTAGTHVEGDRLDVRRARRRDVLRGGRRTAPAAGIAASAAGGEESHLDQRESDELAHGIPFFSPATSVRRGSVDVVDGEVLLHEARHPSAPQRGPHAADPPAAEAGL